MVVSVCESQRQLYSPTAPSTVGVPDPRKNQIWTAQVFQKFAKDKQNVRMQIVGARYTRVYEMEYLQKLREVVGDDPRIELIDVSENVDQFYKNADCLILISLNEVTPMVISESLCWGIPVLNTNIGGIKEMLTDGVVEKDKEKALFTPPILTSSRYCAQEKLNWVREYLGEEWLENCHDKVHLKQCT